MLGKKRFLCVFLAFFLLLGLTPQAFAAEEVVYLAKIVSLTAVYDKYTEEIEFHFETTGTLYHEQRFAVTVTCTAFEDGEWVEGKLISHHLYGFDGCTIGGNIVENTLALSKEAYQNPLLKDFVLTVDGEQVDMGDIDGKFFDLDTKAVPVTDKAEPTGEFFTLATAISSKNVVKGDTFTYSVKPTQISKNLSGGLSRFAFTLNYDPDVMKLDGIECLYPRGTAWSFTECNFVADGYRVSLEGQGIKDDGDVTINFRFISLKSTDTTELYALDVGGGDAYGHSYTAESYVLLEARPIIKDAVLGDLNADDYIDSIDATIVLKYDAGLISAVSAGGDVNGDGYVDSLDASIILKYDAGILDSIG